MVIADPRLEASRQQREELAGRFLAVIEEGDTEGLVSMLAVDAVLYADGAVRHRRSPSRSAAASGSHVYWSA